MSQVIPSIPGSQGGAGKIVVSGESAGGTLTLSEISHALRHNAEAKELAQHYDALHDLVMVATARKRRKTSKGRHRHGSGGREGRGRAVRGAGSSGVGPSGGAAAPCLCQWL